MSADTSTRDDAFRSLAASTVELLAGLAATVDGSRRRKEAASRSGPILLSTVLRPLQEFDLFAQLERPGSGEVVAVAGEVDQETSTSSMTLAYKDASLQKSRVSVISPSCGMMASAAAGAALRAYQPVNL
jgi:fermentation-respiration switch protein FrsA (DUF1100 family)